MKVNLTNFQNPLQQDKTVKTTKLLLFRVGQLFLAVHVVFVVKVLRYLPVHGSGLSYMGVAHLGQEDIAVVDLHRRLFHVSQQVQSGTNGYLILCKNSEGEFFGIWVGETPTLVDVAVSQIRVLPESYRTHDTLEIASHVTLIQDKEQSLTVFVLEVDRLVKPALSGV